jgi:hypothetical protein
MVSTQILHIFKTSFCTSKEQLCTHTHTHLSRTSQLKLTQVRTAARPGPSFGKGCGAVGWTGQRQMTCSDSAAGRWGRSDIHRPYCKIVKFHPSFARVLGCGGLEGSEITRFILAPPSAAGARQPGIDCEGRCLRSKRKKGVKREGISFR